MSEIKSKMIKIISLLLLPFLATAQQQANDDFFTNIGKIYVVLAVICILFLGIVSYMVYLERKINRLEKEKDIN